MQHMQQLPIFSSTMASNMHVNYAVTVQQNRQLSLNKSISAATEGTANKIISIIIDEMK